MAEDSIPLENELTDIVMYNGINIDINLFENEIDGKRRKEKGSYWGNLPYRIENFVRSIEKGELVFSKWVNEGEFWMAEEYLPNPNLIQSLRRNSYRWSERVELFYQCFEKLNLLLGFQIKNDDFLDLVKEIRLQLRSESFKKIHQRRIWKSERNKRSAISYVRSLWDMYAKILVLRIDFSWRSDFAWTISIDEMKNYFKKFINSKRSKESLFKPLIGYIWKLECGEEKGLHYHFIFLFDGSKVHKDAYLATLIGQYWEEEITAGRGLHYNCNYDKNKYKALGIGMIAHGDSLLRQNMESLVIGYLTKKDQYLIHKRTGDRTFGKGILPPQRTRAGRPRGVQRTRSLL